MKLTDDEIDQAARFAAAFYRHWSKAAEEDTEVEREAERLLTSAKATPESLAKYREQGRQRARDMVARRTQREMAEAAGAEELTSAELAKIQAMAAEDRQALDEKRIQKVADRLLANLTRDDPPKKSKEGNTSAEERARADRIAKAGEDEERRLEKRRAAKAKKP